MNMLVSGIPQAVDIGLRQSAILNLSEIDIPADRARTFDQDEAAALAAAIKVQGLLHPIRVRPVDGRYRLVFGWRRLEAFRINGEQAIPATISTACNDDEARLEEVMENLGRGELTALDRCHHLYELQRVWEKLYPETKRGGDRKSEEIKVQKLHFDPAQPQVFGFAEAVAEKIGLSRRSIFLAVSIWKGLSVTSRSRLVGTALARHQGNLKALSEQTPAIQKNVLDLLLAEPVQAASVADALVILEQGRLPSHVEKKFASLNKAISRLKDEELDTVLTGHVDRIVGWLQRTGRI